MKNGQKGDEITASKLRGIIPLFNKDTVLRGAKTFSITNKMRLPLPSMLAEWQWLTIQSCYAECRDPV
jgi:hypothetical protein